MTISVTSTEGKDGLPTEDGNVLPKEGRGGFATEHRDGFSAEDRNDLSTEERDGLSIDDRNGLSTEDRDSSATEQRDGFSTETTVARYQFYLKYFNVSGYKKNTCGTDIVKQLNQLNFNFKNPNITFLKIYLLVVYYNIEWWRTFFAVIFILYIYNPGR